MMKRRHASRAFFFAALIPATAAFILAGLKTGAVERPWADILDALFLSGSDPALEYVVLHLRLPKALAAFSVGAVLALNGVMLQNVLGNPLASSFTLGLSQGAAFGAGFSLIILASAGMQSVVSIVALGAFAGALSASALILAFSMVRGMTPQGLILAGIALSALFGAGTMSLQYVATDSQVAATVFWTFGDLSKGGWLEASLAAAALAAGLLFSLRFSLDYDALRWGDAQAFALGVSVKKVRFLSLLAASLMTGCVTAFYGVIGFVGLVAPHMIRLLFPHAGHFFLLPASALFGGFFLLGADLAAQNILYPVLLPVGIVCAFTGVPVFLFLLLKRQAANA